ncbi:hypothetical protein ACXIZN_43285, partial [Amycolatopsis sp. TRM77291]
MDSKMGLDLTCRGILGRTAETVRCPVDFKPVWEKEGRSWMHELSDPKAAYVIQESRHIYTGVTRPRRALK